MRISLLTDPDDVAYYFNNYIPGLKAKSLVAAVCMHLSNAEFLADLYRTPTSDLETLKQKVDADWKKRSLLTKTIDAFLGPIMDRPKEVRNEIGFRRQNVRRSEEWKQPFINLANRYSGKEFEEVRDYILNDAMHEYQQAHQLN